jgi:hypothetical protein
MTIVFTDKEVCMMLVNMTLGPSQHALQRIASGGAVVLAPGAWGHKPSNLKADTLHLSYQGKQMFHLHISGKESDENPAVSWGAQITDSRTDPTLKLLDKHIAKAGNILERMKEVAKSAQDASLSDDDRLSLQMEMGSLQHELDCETEKMYNKFYSGKETVALHQSNFADTDAYKMLERAAERLANGEEWNVAEVLTPVVKGDVIDRYEWEVTNDVNAPTVDDILKAKGRSVMDSEAARLSEAELENDLSKLLKQRDKLYSFVNRNGTEPQEMIAGGLPADTPGGRMLSSLFDGTMRVLNSFSRDPVLYNIGVAKDENGNYVEFGAETDPLETKYAAGYSFAQKSVVDNALMATVVHSKLNSTWSLNIQISLNLELAANTGTKTVLRHDPSRDIPGSSTKWVTAVEITDQDPEFYRETPKVHTIYNDSNSLISSFNGFFEYGKSSGVTVYKKIPDASLISVEIKGYFQYSASALHASSEIVTA